MKKLRSIRLPWVLCLFLLLGVSGMLASILYFASFLFSIEDAKETKIPHHDPAAVGQPSEPKTILVVGDIMLGRDVETLMQRNGEDYPFANVDETLKAQDAVVANLEGPTVSDHVQTSRGSLVFSFPDTTTGLLKRHNVTAVTLANNHTLNQGGAGLAETRALLSEAGVDAFGDPSAIGEHSWTLLTLQGHDVVIAGFHATQSSFPVDDAQALLARLRTEHSDALLLVFLHWGNEYQPRHNAFQELFGHALIDSGADAVIGAHPHVVQDVEVYKAKPIFYSLGNFIFDQYFSVETQQELGVKIIWDGKDVRYELVPFISETSQPRQMNDEEKAPWLAALAARSIGLTVDGLITTTNRENVPGAANFPYQMQ